MARITLAAPQSQHVSHRGSFYTRTWKGVLIAQAWPRKRKTRRTNAELQRERNFADIIWALRFTDAAIISTAIDAFRKSKVLWRDALTAQFFDTLFALSTNEEGDLIPQRFIALLHRALHTLGSEPGVILSRTPTRWKLIPAAPAGAVLTSAGPNEIPGWE